MTEKVTKVNKQKSLSQIEYGNWLFAVGVLIVIISIFFNLDDSMKKIVVSTLLLFGVLIGILNIRKKEIGIFLIASLFLVMAITPIITVQNTNGAVFSINIISYMLQPFQTLSATLYNYIMNASVYFLALIIPASLIVSLKAIFLTAKDK